MRQSVIVIRKMFRYALSQKLCTERQVPVWDFVVEKQASIRRRITNDDIKNLMETVASWRQESKNPVDQYHRLVLMHVVLLVESSGMRSGEVFGLRNRYAERLNDDQVRVTVKADTSKVGRDRSIIVRAPFLIEFWFGSAQKFRDPDDYLFSPYKDGKVSARDVFYHSYKSLRESLKAFELDRVDLYHCRHWYITERLLAGESIHLVAKAVGTSVSEIEKTYSNVLTEQITERFSETIVEFDNDGHFKLRKVKLK